MTLPSLKGVGITPITSQPTPRVGAIDVLKEIPSSIKKVFEYVKESFRTAPERYSVFEKSEEGKLVLNVDKAIEGGLGFIPMGMAKAVPKITKIDSVKKVISVLKKTKTLRKAQEELYKKIKGEKLIKALKVSKKITGEKGFYAEKAALKGKLPTVQFKSIRKQVGQKTIDDLFIKVKESPVLSEWDKIPAREGLAKIFGRYGGKIPTKGELSLLERALGTDFVKTISAKKPFFTKLKEAGVQLANIPRSIMSSFDLSAPLRQGAFFIGRVKQFVPAFRRMFKLFGNEKAFKAIQQEIIRKPTFKLMKEGKLAITEMGSILGGREERFMSQWAEKIPLVGKVVRASGRAYTGFLNKLRADVFDDLIRKATTAGLDPKKNPALVKEIAKFINAGTGRGALGALEGSAVGLNSLFFSPRLVASRLTLLNPLYYVRSSKFVRKEALKSLFSFAGAALTVMGLSKMAGATVETDMRSSDWAKIKIGNTRIDVLGGFQQYIKLAAQMYSGKIVSSTTGKILTLGEGYRPLTRLDILTRFAEYKEAPIFSFATNMLKGQDFAGQPINIPKEIGIRFIPMVIQDIIEIAKDDPDLLPLSALGIFGVGLQTYDGKYKTKSKKRKAGLPSLKGVGF